MNLLYLGKEKPVHDSYNIDLNRLACLQLDGSGESKLVVVPDLRWKRAILRQFGWQGSKAADILASLEEVSMASTQLLGDYDIVHMEYLFDWPQIASALITKCVRRNPHVVDFVDLIDAIAGPSKRRAMLYKIGYLPTWATVVSDYIGSQLVSKGFAKHKIFKIPMGVDPAKVRHVKKEEARQALGLPQEQQLIGFELGSGMWNEYVDLLLACFREVLRHLSGVKFVFIGHAETWLDKIRHGVNSMGLHRNVILTGMLRTEELGPWLEACDVLVLPLRDTAYDIARLPGRFGDYLAAGRPIVAAAVGDTQNIIRRGCGLLAEPGNHIDFASKILSILKDDDLMQRMGEVGRHLAENDYSWKRMAIRLEEAYETIIAA